MTEDRAAQAFQEAFARQTGGFDPEALSMPQRAPRRRWMPAVLAAASVFALGIASLLITMRTDNPQSSPNAPARVESDATFTDPPAGWHWVSWHDIAVQVPDSWDWGVTPLGPWCTMTENLDRGPYVARDTSLAVIAGVGCADAADPVPEPFKVAVNETPARLWVPHVAWSPDEVEGRWTHAGWVLRAVTLGDSSVAVLVPSDQRDLATRILASARPFQVDHNGCAATSPVDTQEFVRPDAFDIQRLDAVASVSVCSYLIVPSDWAEPTLMGSRSLTGQVASEVLRAIQEAPTGGGPDRSNGCLSTRNGDSALALHFNTGATSHQAYVYSTWCFGNGIDDGTNKYRLTQANCKPLFDHPPVSMWQGDPDVFEACVSD